jgi:hypothetical protein
VFFNQGKFDVCQLGRLGQYFRGDRYFPDVMGETSGAVVMRSSIIRPYCLFLRID